MGKKRPEREQVEELLKTNPQAKAHAIAEAAGLIEALGYDKAVNYVRRIKKEMKARGIIVGAYATDHDRLKDITTLFEIRRGRASKRAAYYMLFMNCYYRLRSENDDIHINAIDDTYAKNQLLGAPLAMFEVVRLCEKALAWYMNSIDPEKDEAAKRRGFPGAGLNYTDGRFIDKLDITDKELEYMVSIRKEDL